MKYRYSESRPPYGYEWVSINDRLGAWEQIADHPFFISCYGSDKSLIEAMLDKLDEVER